MRAFTRRENPRAYRTRFAWAGGFSLVCWMAVQILAPGGSLPWTPAMQRAAEGMEATLGRFSAACPGGAAPSSTGLTADGTCLIGPELGPLFTSLGQVEAKRTALAPDVAALLVHLLSEAGVGPGDRVAVGASGSFPGFLIATLEAVTALEAEAVTVLSLGASSFGATDPSRSLLHVYEGLQPRSGLDPLPAAVSLGGSGDVGGEFEPAFRDSLVGALEAQGATVLFERDLSRNVASRMTLYHSRGQEPAAFVNIGGAEANLGVSPAVLSLPPGLIRPGEEAVLPPGPERGVLFEMLAVDVPVLHLLHVRGLALRFGLSWDPIVLPPAGATRFQAGPSPQGGTFWLLTILFVVGLVAIFIKGRRPSAKEVS